MPDEKREIDSLLVTFDYSGGQNCILLVGKKTPNYEAEVISAFEGEEALAIYKKLTNGGVLKEDKNV